MSDVFQFLVANWSSIVGGIIASSVFVALTWLSKTAIERLQAWRFKQIFGRRINPPEFSLIYAELKQTSDESHAYTLDDDPSVLFSIEHAVSSCEVRAANYLANAIGRTVRKSPSIESAAATRKKLDFNFVSLGGPKSNPKTADVQDNPANKLLRFDQQKDNFFDLRTGKPLISRQRGFDYGMILKVRPSQFPNRVWIACAGFGEWGTSGSAWFLANKWHQLWWVGGRRPFAAIISVKQGQDESALMVYPKLSIDTFSGAHPLLFATSCGLLSGGIMVTSCTLGHPASAPWIFVPPFILGFVSAFWHARLQQPRK